MVPHRKPHILLAINQMYIYQMYKYQHKHKDQNQMYFFLFHLLEFFTLRVG